MRKNYWEKELAKINVELDIAHLELAFQNDEKEKRAIELIIANTELAYLKKEKENRAAELFVANLELAFQNKEKELRAGELATAKGKLGLQNEEKKERAAELVIAKKELVFQNKEKGARAAELKIANKKLAIQNKEKDKRSAELIIANIDLAFQIEEKRKREAELLNSNLELKKAEGQFRLLVESASYAMVLVNEESLITLVNSKTEKLFGYERCELTGKKFGNLIQEQFQYPYYDLRHRFLNLPDFKNNGGDKELFCIRKDGSPFQAEIELIPIETADGPLVLISILDITERVIQEATIQRQMELEIKNKNLEDFAYLASHDLQEPLRNILGLIQLFDKKYFIPNDKDDQMILETIKGTTNRMSMLIKSLLEFSMIGHNTEISSVDLNVLLAEVIGDLGDMVKRSGAVFQVQTLPTLSVYEFQIRQIFQNIITNAIKFSKKEVQPVINISVLKMDKMWEFSVSDNGIGIAAIHFDKVFMVFKRLNSKTAYEGCGIGLANCKKIAHLHQGDIWLESTVGKGSTFHFTIADLTVGNN